MGKKSSEEPLTTQSSEEPLTTQKNNIDTLLASSSEVYMHYYYFLNNNNNNNGWLRTINHSTFKDSFPQWLGIFFKPDYLKVIYHLVKNRFCHAKGLVKLFHENINTCVYRLTNLQKYGVIESVKNKEKYENILYKHRKAFRIDDYHYAKAEWYQLTKIGYKFYSNLDFSLSLNPLLIEHVNDYTKALSKTTDKVKREITRSKDFVKHIFPSYKKRLELPEEVKLIDWATGVIETHFRKTGVVLDILPHDLLDELNEMLKEEKESD